MLSVRGPVREVGVAQRARSLEVVGHLPFLRLAPSLPQRQTTKRPGLTDGFGCAARRGSLCPGETGVFMHCCPRTQSEERDRTTGQDSYRDQNSSPIYYYRSNGQTCVHPSAQPQECNVRAATRMYVTSVTHRSALVTCRYRLIGASASASASARTQRGHSSGHCMAAPYVTPKDSSSATAIPAMPVVMALVLMPYAAPWVRSILRYLSTAARAL
jgi:hypothetical protein